MKSSLMKLNHVSTFSGKGQSEISKPGVADYPPGKVCQECLFSVDYDLTRRFLPRWFTIEKI